MLEKLHRPLWRAVVVSLVSLSIPTVALAAAGGDNAVRSTAPPAPPRAGLHVGPISRGSLAGRLHFLRPTPPKKKHRLPWPRLRQVEHLGGVNWIAIARCESGLHWHIADAPFYGGLQFMTSTWVANGGRRYAPRADLARPAQQIVIARHLQQRAGLGPWPVCGSRG